MKRTILSLLVMLIGVTGAWAMDNVPYVDMVVTTDANGNVTVTPVTKYANNVTVVSSSSNRVTWTAGWYYVNGVNVNMNGITCNDDVHLILGDGAKLTTGAVYAEEDRNDGSLFVTGSSSLTIYGQTNQTGQLVAIGKSGDAGIGANNGWSGGHITINGGVVTANGGDNAAGIGGGIQAAGRDIKINGGVVIATGGINGAGIGGGNRLNEDESEFFAPQNGGYGYNIKINGGDVTATGGDNGTGIGGGNHGTGYGIEFANGQVTASGGENAPAIGGGAGASSVNIFAYAEVIIKADNYTPPTNSIGEHNITTDIANTLSDKRYVIANPVPPMTITLDMCGGRDGSTSVTATYGHAMPEITLPTRTGHTFQGYFTEQSGAGTKYYNADGTSAQNWDQTEAKTLYAHWVANTYTITLDMRGGSKGTESVTATYGVAMPRITSPTRPGYTFYGYFTEQNGQGTKYYNADGTSAQVWDLAEDKTLYAFWVINLYKVTLDMQGGSKGTESVTVMYNNPMPYITPPIRTGCEFGGYFSKQKGEGIQYYNADGTSAHNWDQLIDNRTIYAYWITHVSYVDAEGNLQTIDNPTEVTKSDTRVTWTAGWYVVLGDVSLGDGAICSGDVHLILADGATLTSQKGDFNKDGCIQVSASTGNKLTIYGQVGQTGKLIAHGENRSAGIGGKNNEFASNITINGGIIEAYGGNNAAGIGGGENRPGRIITINRGTVTAIGGNYAAGIGGGKGANAEFIRINGGTVTAEGGINAPAIGAGFGGTANNIYVDASLAIRADNNNPPTSLIGNHSKTTDIAAVLSDKMYAAIEPGVVVATRFAADKGANYSSYYNGTQAFEVVTEDVTLYTASMQTIGNETYLNLNEIEGNILPVGTAVIVRSESEVNVLLAPYTGSTEDIDVSDNVLQGVDIDTEISTLGSGSLYILSAQKFSEDEMATTGFYRYLGDIMPAHKAYLQIAPGTPAPTRIVWGNRPVPTEIENVSGNDNADKVLRDGQLYIIKNGRTYSAQGQLLKL